MTTSEQARADAMADAGYDGGDGCDHACGECGRGIPSYQAHDSTCWTCEDEMAREASAPSRD